MYTQTTSGIFLSKTEAKLLEDTLVHMILAQANDGRTILSLDPKDLLCKLDWAPQRHVEVRDHLECWPTRERISQRIGKPLEDITMSPTLLSVTAGTPLHNRNATIAALSAVLDMIFDMARKWMDPEEMRAWANERLDLLFR